MNSLELITKGNMAELGLGLLVAVQGTVKIT